MAFTTEERYRAYADWTSEYIEKIKRILKVHLGGPTSISKHRMDS